MNEELDVFPITKDRDKFRRQEIADAFCGSMSEVKQRLISVIPGGHFLRQDYVCAIATGVSAAPLNGVWLEQPEANMATVATLLDAVSNLGVPYHLKLRPGSGEMFIRIAEARDMDLVGEIALMAVADADAITEVPQPHGFVIRQLSPSEAPEHARIAALAFGVAPDAFMRAVSPDLLRLDTVRCYVGEVKGQPVATSLSVTLGVFTAILNVVTAPDFRGCGFGTAVTAKAVADGLATGSKWCWLEATPSHLPCFLKVGFRTIEQWQYWEKS